MRLVINSPSRGITVKIGDLKKYLMTNKGKSFGGKFEPFVKPGRHRIWHLIVKCEGFKLRLA